MSVQSWCETVYVQGAGTSLTAAAEALLVSDVQIPGGYMYPGRVMHGIVVGKASSAATTPGTLTLRIRWGGLAGTILAASAAMTQNIAVQQDETIFYCNGIQNELSYGAVELAAPVGRKKSLPLTLYQCYHGNYL